MPRVHPRRRTQSEAGQGHLRQPCGLGHPIPDELGRVGNMAGVRVGKSKIHYWVWLVLVDGKVDHVIL